MGGSITLARIRGIPIRVHYSLLIALPFLAYLFAQHFLQAARLADVPPNAVGGTPYVWGAVIALGLFVSVLLHELAHALYALRSGGRVTDITLLMIGGISRVAEMPRQPRREAVMAFVGPLTSLLLGVLFVWLHRFQLPRESFNLRFALFCIGHLNLVLGVFNLLPAFPMDGGRILRALLVGRLGVERATRAAATVGKVFAALFAIVGLFSFNWLLVLVAWFIYIGAQEEGQHAVLEARLSGVLVRDLMVARTASIDASTSLEDASQRLLEERRNALPVVEKGAVVGVLTLEHVRSVAADRRAEAKVLDVARIDDALKIDAAEPAAKALRVLSESGIPELPVVSAGEVIGTISVEDIARAVELRKLADAHSVEKAA